MAESDLHLKLDRILAGQAAQQKAITDNGYAIQSLTAGLSQVAGMIEEQNNWLAKLSEAMSQEKDGSELHDLLMQIETRMGQMVTNGNEMIEALNALPQAITDATADGVRLAMNKG